MPQSDLHTLLEEVGAIQKGHFILSSGRHSDVYVEKFRLLERPDLLDRLAATLAESAPECDYVVGPTTGGILVAYAVARLLGVPARYVETFGNVKQLRRGASLTANAKVFAVDDVLTTGLSLRETVAAINESGGQVVGVGTIIDRSEEDLDFGVPLVSAIRVDARSWAPSDLPAHLSSSDPVRPGTRGLV